MVYFLTEDSTTGYIFWNTVLTELFGDKIVVCKGDGASKLVRTVCKLQEDNNTYLVAYDNAFDNENAMNGYRKIRQYARSHKNIVLLELISFEWVLLTFNKLVYFLNTQVDMSKRAYFVDIREKLLGALDPFSDYSLDDYMRVLNEYKGCSNKNYTVESLTSSLLKNLTKGTGFSVDKEAKENGDKLGDCWLVSCCSFQQYVKCDWNISRSNKARCIYENTCIYDEFKRKKVLEVIENA